MKKLEINQNSALATILGTEFDLLVAVGGVRGIIESILPTVVFLVGLVILGEHLVPAFIALGVCVLFIIARIVQRIAVAPAVGGLLAMLISVVLAWRSGQASDIFLWGILINLLYFAVFAISALVKWPLIGVLIGLVQGVDLRWRKRGVNPEFRKVAYQLTWLWTSVFALRLIVQLPLYWANAPEALGIVKLAMGLPLFALALWCSWLRYRAMRLNTPNPPNLPHFAE